MTHQETHMSQHTPGPWRIGLTLKKGDVWKGWRETDINGPEGCFLTLSQYHEADEADANARLIAAAPEMAALLERTIPLLVMLGDHIGNGPIDIRRRDSMGVRCDLIGDIREALGRIGGVNGG